MKRNLTLLAVASILILIAIGIFAYLGYRRVLAVETRVNALTVQVNDATKLAEEQAAAVSAASLRANEAAARAEQAAVARKEAETAAQQAQAGRDQALTAAQQAQAGREQALTAAQKAAQQASEADAQASQAQAEMQSMRQERAQELNQMQEALNKVVETHRTSNGMVMVLPESTFRFPFDSADLSQKNRELLSRIAGILLVSKGYGLSIFGYTDDLGSPEYNQKLSFRRANAVRDYLVQAGLNSAIINAKGYGKTSPIVPDTSAESRAKNRRVEIALTDSSLTFTGVAPEAAPSH